MTFPFVKMQAQGNDFVILDALHDDIPALDTRQICNITERRYGIGCDQLLWLEKAENADARMRIFNTDGSEAMNCGNGLRCAADLLMRRLHRQQLRIALPDRTVQAMYSEHGVRVCMGQARIEDACKTHSDVHIGNRHRVLFALAGEDELPHDRNVEIITGHIADHVYIDIIELGVGPTRACGSGASATAAAIWQREDHERPLTIEMPGGQVLVTRQDDQLWLEGRVAEVFHGVYDGKGDQCSTS